MLKVIGFVVYVLLSTLEPKAEVKQFENVKQCYEWHQANAEKLNAEFAEKPYRAFIADCVDLGEEL